MGWRMQQGYQCREMMMSVGRKVERVFPSPIPLVILAPPIPLVILALPIPLVILAHPTMVILAHPILLEIRAPTTFSPTPSQLLKHPLEPTPQSQQKGSVRHRQNSLVHNMQHECKPMHEPARAHSMPMHLHTYTCLTTTQHTHTMHLRMHNIMQCIGRANRGPMYSLMHNVMQRIGRANRGPMHRQ